MAKRNFGKRHAHGTFIPDNNQTSITYFNGGGGHDHQQLTAHIVPRAHTISPPEVALGGNGVNAGAANGNRTGRESQQVVVQLFPGEFRWLNVLYSRPDTSDTEGMMRWVQNVMQVSDAAIAEGAPTGGRDRGESISNNQRQEEGTDQFNSQFYDLSHVRRFYPN